MKNNILITGGSGFLGKKLTETLKKDKNNNVISISSKDVDLRYYDSLRYIPEVKFNKIYHLATWTQAGDFSLYHSGEQWVFNQLINSNILFWWHNKQQQSKFISIAQKEYEELLISEQIKFSNKNKS